MIVLNYDLVIAIVSAVLFLIGGMLFSLSFRRETKRVLHIFGGLLYGLSVICTLFLGCVFIINLFSGLSSYAVFSMADAWIGSSMVSVTWSVIIHSLVSVSIAVVGLVVSIVLVSIWGHKSSNATK